MTPRATADQGEANLAGAHQADEARKRDERLAAEIRQEEDRSRVTHDERGDRAHGVRGDLVAGAELMPAQVGAQKRRLVGGPTARSTGVLPPGESDLEALGTKGSATTRATIQQATTIQR